MKTRIDKLKSCDKCRKVWHKTYRITRTVNYNGYSYYNDFPHYGLEKVDCPKCKEIKNGSNA